MKEKRRAEPRKADRKARQQAAEELAIAALSFLATEPEEIGRFLALTGLDPQSLRGAARQPGFLLGVLDHLAGDERLLLVFAERNDIDPDDVERARAVLAGEGPEQS